MTAGERAYFQFPKKQNAQQMTTLSSQRGSSTCQERTQETPERQTKTKAKVKPNNSERTAHTQQRTTNVRPKEL